MAVIAEAELAGLGIDVHRLDQVEVLVLWIAGSVGTGPVGPLSIRAPEPGAGLELEPDPTVRPGAEEMVPCAGCRVGTREPTGPMSPTASSPTDERPDG